MAKKYLLPSGKSLTEAQLDRLPISRVFTLLRQLGVSDRYQATGFNQLSARTRRRSTRTRNITKYYTPKEVDTYIYWEPDFSPVRRVRSPPTGRGCTSYHTRASCPGTRCMWTSSHPTQGTCLTR